MRPRQASVVLIPLVLAIVAIEVLIVSAQSSTFSTGNFSTSRAVCFGATDDAPATTCVPLSILRATFEGYQAGQPSPLYVAQQQLISVQVQYVQELESRRQCEGQLGPLQAKAQATILSQQQDRLDAAAVAATPPGMLWNKQTKTYVPAPVDSRPPAER